MPCSMKRVSCSFYVFKKSEEQEIVSAIVFPKAKTKEISCFKWSFLGQAKSETEMKTQSYNDI